MRGGRLWLVVGLAALAVPALVDIATGDDAFARSLYLLPVLAIATRARAREVAIVGLAAIALAVLSTLWNEGGGSALPLVTVVAGTAIAVLAARERHDAIAARSAAETERRQLRLLGDAARITDGAADIDEALRRLLDLLVPDFADAAWVDVLQPGGVRRLAARAAGPDREELEAWLRARGAVQRAEHSPTTRVLRGEGSQLAELDAQLGAAIAHDDEDRRLMALSQLRWTMALPLAPSGEPLGALGLGVGRSGRRYGAADLRFAELLVGRAGLALANAQLVSRLTATQRRLDGIFNSLAQAVTVQSSAGRLEYANPAAAALLGLPGVHEVLTADASDLVGRFEIRHPDGRPVQRGRAAGRARAPRRAAGAAADPERLQGDRRAALVPHQRDAAAGRERRAAGGQRDRGRHRAARGDAAPALPLRGRRGARILARLRAHAATGRAARRAGARGLVRGRAAGRARHPGAGRARPHRSGAGGAGACAARALSAGSRRAGRRRGGDAQRRGAADRAGARLAARGRGAG